MTGNYFWPAIRVKNFMNYLNKNGLLHAKPTHYDQNIEILAAHIGVPVTVFLQMNPLEYGQKAFGQWCAHPSLKEVLGWIIYRELLVIYREERNKLQRLYTPQEISVAETLVAMSR